MPDSHLEVDDLTPEWLTAVLNVSYPGVTVSTLEHVNVTWGASGKVRVRATYNDAGQKAGLPPTMIIKGGFGRQPGMAHMYGIEVASFAKVVPQIDVLSPKCFFAGEEPKAQDPMLVMEDLAPHNVRFNEALKPLTLPEAKRHIEAMARFHSSLWDSDELKAGGSLEGIDEIVANASRIRLDREAQPAVWNSYLSMPRGAPLPAIITDPDRLFPALKRLWELNATSPYTTTHNDCHMGNTYMYPDGRVGFLDWAVKRAPWYKDFAYFIVTALDIANRRQWERMLLEHYLVTLRQRGIDAPSLEEAWFLYRCELVYPFTVWVCNGDPQGQFQDEAINTACAVRAGMAVLDHGSIGLLGY